MHIKQVLSALKEIVFSLFLSLIYPSLHILKMHLILLFITHILNLSISLGINSIHHWYWIYSSTTPVCIICKFH